MKSDGKATVRFTVTDTGIGIPRNQIEALFSPFTQADDSTTRKYGGTGLGLAISKQLVEMMGGKIGIESQEGAGSTFWFTAAFERTQDPALASTVGPVPQNSATERIKGRFVSPSGLTVKGREPRILVAEDNATNRAVALAQLKKLGYKSDAVANGSEAVEALQHDGYDLVLMDCEMPVMDGFEATHLIRKSSHPLVPIIALTASAMSGDRNRCICEGMNDYLSKPVELEQLAEVLAKWCPTTDPSGTVHSAEAAASEQTGAVFDQEALLKRLMGDRQLAGVIVKGFLEDFPTQLNNLCQRYIEEDGAGTRLQAHALRGSAATVSACSLSAIAAKMEETVGAGEWGRFGTLVPRAVEEFKLLKSTLEHVGWHSPMKESL